VSFDRTRLLRLTAGSLVALTLMVAGDLIGAIVWPRAVKVEQRVVAPAINAVAFTPVIERLGDMVAQNCPAVVAIEQDGPAPDTADDLAASNTAMPAGGAAPVHRATGFLVSNDGYVLASADQLSDQGAVRILLNDGRTLGATQSGRDPISGLALLKADGTSLPFLKFAASAFPRVGDWAVAVSSPNGSGCVVATGAVASDSLAEQDRLRIYARVTPGLAAGTMGAPLLNMEGDVIGVVGLGAQAGAPDRASTVLPAAIASPILSELLRSGKPADNRFGIVADDLLPTLATRMGADRQRGAMVSLIDEGSPADKNGLRAGDLILAVAGSPISGASELARALDTDEDSLSLDVLRRAKKLTISLQAPPSRR
jgi:serine protease Do